MVVGLLGLLITLSRPLAARQSPTDAQRIATDIQRESGVPGVAVAVVRSEGLVAIGVAGVRRAGSADPIQPSDLFHLGSVTKSISATVIGEVVDAGRLAWTSTPADVFPEWQGAMNPALSNITLAQILAHQAGIQAFTDQSEYDSLPRFSGDAKTRRLQFAHYLLTRPPAIAPGTGYLYSNAGYSLAASMAERVTGKSWEDLVREQLFDPLNLRTAVFGWPGLVRAAEPWGLLKVDGSWAPQNPRGPYQLGPLGAASGDLSMTVGDVARFLELHLRDLRGDSLLVKSATMDRLHAQYSTLASEALGWDLQITNSGERISIKTGSAGTFYALVFLSEKRDLGIAILINAPDTSAAFTAAGRLLAAYSPKTSSP